MFFDQFRGHSRIGGGFAHVRLSLANVERGSTNVVVLEVGLNRHGCWLKNIYFSADGAASFISVGRRPRYQMSISDKARLMAAYQRAIDFNRAFSAEPYGSELVSKAMPDVTYL